MRRFSFLKLSFCACNEETRVGFVSSVNIEPVERISRNFFVPMRLTFLTLPALR